VSRKVNWLSPAANDIGVIAPTCCFTWVVQYDRVVFTNTLHVLLYVLVLLHVLVLTAEFVASHCDQNRAFELGLYSTLIRHVYYGCIFVLHLGCAGGPEFSPPLRPFLGSLESEIGRFLLMREFHHLYPIRT
jgi:hypothetical protein